MCSSTTEPMARERSILDRYTVVKTGNERVPYELHGPRGAKYGLMRNVPNPHMLFAVNLRSFVASATAQRLGWFTDKDGELRSVR
jgi:hypothetical protein